LMLYRNPSVGSYVSVLDRDGRRLRYGKVYRQELYIRFGNEPSHFTRYVDAELVQRNVLPTEPFPTLADLLVTARASQSPRDKLYLMLREHGQQESFAPIEIRPLEHFIKMPIERGGFLVAEDCVLYPRDAASALLSCLGYQCRGQFAFINGSSLRLTIDALAVPDQKSKTREQGLKKYNPIHYLAAQRDASGKAILKKKTCSTQMLSWAEFQQLQGPLKLPKSISPDTLVFFTDTWMMLDEKRNLVQPAPLDHETVEKILLRASVQINQLPIRGLFTFQNLQTCGYPDLEQRAKELLQKH